MLKVHFLNVGHGDCSIVELPDGNVMMVDINRSNEFDEETAKELAEELGLDFIKIKVLKEKVGIPYFDQITKADGKAYDIALSDPITYLEDLGVESIYRYVQTHPHMDHLAGFAALAEKWKLQNFWDTDHRIEKKDFQSDSDKTDWRTYKEYRKENTPLFYYRSTDPNGGQYPYELYVFHPTKQAVKDGNTQNNPNLMSYLILLKCGDYKCVFGGDVTEEYWQEIWRYINFDGKARQLFSNVHSLKASHHGRKSGRCGREMLDLMDPKFVIISVGKKDEKNDATDWYRLRPNGSTRNVWTTRWRGTICVEAGDDGKVVVSSEYDRKDLDRQHIRNIPYTVLAPSPHSLKIKARCKDFKASKEERKYRNNQTTSKHKYLVFRVEHDIPGDFETRWRIVNTGEEARQADALRGGFDSDNSQTPHQRLESTLYKGTHYIECFALKDHEVVARSNRFYVKIK